jgi:hypothetical protein
MTEKAERLPRILLVLGPSTPTRDALSAAVAFAARLSAELHPLFVEEEELLRAAALPFARQLDRLGHNSEPLDEATVKAGWQSLSSAAGATLRRSATELGVPLHFRVTRGATEQEVVRASASVDMIMFASAQRPRVMRERSGLPIAFGSRVCVLRDGSASAERALNVARALANTWPPEVGLRAMVRCSALRLVTMLGARRAAKTRAPKRSNGPSPRCTGVRASLRGRRLKAHHTQHRKSVPASSLNEG